MFFRLRCHFCGKRSQYSKGTNEFQCTQCEAWNFFDQKGEVVDTPAEVAARLQHVAPINSPYQTFTRPQEPIVPQQQYDIFCKRCRSNQQIYMETLSNYLPDESHPRYQEYEDKLPEFKANLEQKYPQVCTNCASRVQEKLHHVDRFGRTQQTARMMSETRKRGGRSTIGQRDDWGKWTMRLLLSIIGAVVYTSLLAQILWHTYGMLTAFYTTAVTENFDGTTFASDATLKDCLLQSRLLRFDTACYQLCGTLIPRVLIASLCLVWYNHGLKSWYHDTYRMEAVHGKTEHFRIQVFLLIIRTIAWYNLSDPAVITDLHKQQQLAAHAFMIAFMILSQWISERTISTQRWQLTGTITPHPDHKNVFGATAGPAEEQYDRQASSRHPLQLFEHNQRPFPIENLAPKPRRGYSKVEIPAMPPPSPPDSGTASDDGMDIDLQWKPPLRSQIPGAPIDRTFRQKNYEARRPQTRSAYNHGSTQPLGWGSMRNELFGIQDQTRAEDERKRREEEERAKLRYQPEVKQSPFYGTLPQAPMSMERKLRNPPRQVQFKKQPVSEQKNFMQQMRESFENGRSFGRPKVEEKVTHIHDGSGGYDDDEDFSPVKTRTRIIPNGEDLSPAKSRTKGSLNLHDSGWRLPGDFAKATGLEDLLQGGLTINEGPDTQDTPAQRHSVPLPPMWMLAVGTLVATLAIGWNTQPVRRAACLWIVQKIEEMGY